MFLFIMTSYVSSNYSHDNQYLKTYPIARIQLMHKCLPLYKNMTNGYLRPRELFNTTLCFRVKNAQSRGFGKVETGKD